MSRDTSAIMRRVRSRHTAPEMALRRALWARRWRYRLHHTPLPGRPDIVFPQQRIAVFVDGEYWHGGQWERRGQLSLPAQLARLSRSDYWERKIRGNAQRDLATTATLSERGWYCLRFWARDAQHRTERCADRIIARLMQAPLSPPIQAVAARRELRAAGPESAPPDLSGSGWRWLRAPDTGPGALSWWDAHELDPALVQRVTTSQSPCWAIRMRETDSLSRCALEELAGSGRHALDWVDWPATRETVLIGRPALWITPLERQSSGAFPLDSQRPRAVAAKIAQTQGLPWRIRPLPNRENLRGNSLIWLLKHYFDPILTEAIHEVVPESDCAFGSFQD